MRRLPLVLITCTAIAGLTACIPVYHGHGRGYDQGPPAHAPAHGYRRQLHGHELSFDHGLGVYVVIGSPGWYYWDDYYWRLRDGIWVRAVAFDGPWLVVADTHRHLPPGLAKKHGHGKPGGKGKGQDKKNEEEKHKNN